ncbi:LCP family protein, partial [Streptomyces sp. URMC 123]|uniref:LCP family protein n=1 Tax=Streptomyces sp. URMC 123 TaxID=3423403 RepID=UPI003F1A83FF
PRRGGPGRVARGRPRWGLRLATAVSVLVLTASGVGHAMVAGLDTGLHRIDPFRGLGERPRASKGLNFLLVGTDGREEITSVHKELYRLGGAPCNCTDTVMLVHLSADKRRVSVVSIPRDTYAELPEHTDPATGQKRPARPDKLNAAYSHGGPQLTVRTVERLTGVHIDHYLEVDFISFMQTVDVLGGVEVCTPRPLKDDNTGLDIPAGTSRLRGGQALQYVRSRYVDGGSDLGRMQRQQRFLAALVHEVTSSGVLMNPVKLNKVTTTLLDSVRADHGLGSDEMLALGRAMRGFTTESSEFTSVPIANPAHQVPGLGSTVQWDGPKAEKLFAALREDRPLASQRTKRKRGTPVDVSPRQIRVQVDNATTAAGLGQRIDQALRRTGFDTTGLPGNAAPGAGTAGRTVISYDPGWDRSARTLAAALPGAELRSVPGHGPVMRVTLGTDAQQVREVRFTDPLAGGEFAALTGDQVVCA